MLTPFLRAISNFWSTSQGLVIKGLGPPVSSSLPWGTPPPLCARCGASLGGGGTTPLLPLLEAACGPSPFCVLLPPRCPSQEVARNALGIGPAVQLGVLAPA